NCCLRFVRWRERGDTPVVTRPERNRLSGTGVARKRQRTAAPVSAAQGLCTPSLLCCIGINRVVTRRNRAVVLSTSALLFCPFPRRWRHRVARVSHVDV